MLRIACVLVALAYVDGATCDGEKRQKCCYKKSNNMIGNKGKALWQTIYQDLLEERVEVISQPGQPIQTTTISNPFKNFFRNMEYAEDCPDPSEKNEAVQCCKQNEGCCIYSPGLEAIMKGYKGGKDQQNDPLVAANIQFTDACINDPNCDHPECLPIVSGGSTRCAHKRIAPCLQVSLTIQSDPEYAAFFAAGNTIGQENRLRQLCEAVQGGGCSLDDDDLYCLPTEKTPGPFKPQFKCCPNGHTCEKVRNEIFTKGECVTAAPTKETKAPTNSPTAKTAAPTGSPTDAAQREQQEQQDLSWWYLLLLYLFGYY